MKLDPKTKERERKKARNEKKIERIMMGKTVKVYAVNAATVTNKIDTVHDMIQRRDPDFVMISEAGLRDKKSPVIKGYTSFRTDHKNKNRGSIIYMKELFPKVALRVAETNEETVGSEFIHIRLQGEPSVHIISVYMESGITGEDARKTHEILE